jgi:hypothetical protein
MLLASTSFNSNQIDLGSHKKELKTRVRFSSVIHDNLSMSEEMKPLLIQDYTLSSDN